MENNPKKEGIMPIDMPKTVIIGGSALSSISDATVLHTVTDISTPFGNASSPIKILNLWGHTFAFMKRHGIGHTLYPHEIPERANFYLFMKLGVTNVVQFTAIGSVKNIEPGTFVVFKQVYNMTSGRPNKLVEGVVAHISHNNPFCPRLTEATTEAIKQAGIPFNPIKTCACINGPEFGNEIDNLLMRKLGIAAVGMTQYPASILGRWASMCQVIIGLITDQDCAEGDETVSSIHVAENAKKFRNRQNEVLKRLLSKIPKDINCPHCTQTPDIIVTERSKWPQDQIPILTLMFQRHRRQKKK